MTVYVDTSVVLRILLNEPDPVECWGKWDIGYSSQLWRVEALRVSDRLRTTSSITDMQVVKLRSGIDKVHDALHIVSLSDTILKRAGETFPTIVGTLDAIHLSTAVLLSETVQIDLFLTHDIQLATAAKAMGFTVQG